MRIFSVYDSKAEAFITPIFAPTVGVAVRMFQQAAADESHEFFKHAEDYTLFELGVFDEHTGMIDMMAAPKSIIGAYNVRETTVQGGE